MFCVINHITIHHMMRIPYIEQKKKKSSNSFNSKSGSNKILLTSSGSLPLIHNGDPSLIHPFLVIMNARWMLSKDNSHSSFVVCNSNVDLQSGGTRAKTTIFASLAYNSRISQ